MNTCLLAHTPLPAKIAKKVSRAELPKRTIHHIKTRNKIDINNQKRGHKKHAPPPPCTKRLLYLGKRAGRQVCPLAAGVPVPGVLELLVDRVRVADESLAPLRLDLLAQNLSVGLAAVCLAFRHQKHLLRREFVRCVHSRRIDTVEMHNALMAVEARRQRKGGRRHQKTTEKTNQHVGRHQKKANDTKHAHNNNNKNRDTKEEQNIYLPGEVGLRNRPSISQKGMTK